MKKSFLLYAFILLILLNLFTYAYLSKEITFEKSKNESLTKKNQLLNENNLELNYFSLEKNEKAQNYFNPESNTKTILPEKLIPIITEKLLDYNQFPQGNPYTGQDKIGSNKFIINKIKILNHRWIIADFSDGEYWGEVLLKYFINEDETISFELIQSLLYQK